MYYIRNKTGINLAHGVFRAIHAKLGKTMRLFLCGGAKLDKNVAEGLFKFGFTILDGYGLTETSPVLTLSPLKRPKIGSVGTAIPGVEVKILNKNYEF